MKEVGKMILTTRHCDTAKPKYKVGLDPKFPNHVLEMGAVHLSKYIGSIKC